MIHQTASIDPRATIGAGVSVGPFCTVGPDVVLEDGVELVSHVVVDGHTRIGAGTTVFPFATIGLAPQDLKYKGEPTRTELGPNCVIREHCTIHRGTVTGTGITRVGAGCLLMAVVHVAHDCALGENIVIANNVVMGGHVEIADRAIIGGATAIHQFVRIGTGAMVGGASGVEADVIPYGSVIGNRARLHGLNIVGLRRRGLDKEGQHRLRNAYRLLFQGEGTFAARVEALRGGAGDDPYLAEILAFIDAPSKRGLIRSTTRHGDDAEA
ncbi:MAG TPA: acyl-ACP--UDP-N-acetylglucosamine O-acyltransferase [Acidiphilium sp.]|jgi:UDP-N-acetylglucosamine acyltransferase|uniref:acyl-ACP--UDP-N-acetylglucosamine O-acyltransferase n=1 Tax=Acidiphilium sp. C61 TaxID=1671485 RepID=UPI00157B0A8A|nr:acyl-ACP--UDP-N-acetylglucosamine O-acyltransferase [Acidiphilium sp. C61]HQU11765.1 acyl-ACP--UDP-N-acetylglucosamine O-acyltransferase [Acidiphilium sp.]